MRSDKIGDLEFVSFLAAMETRNRIKGINPEECVNFVNALRLSSKSSLDGVLCNASTGGDRLKTINIGTPSAIIIASSGTKVLKIGSKGITSNSGSREVLVQFGIDVFESLDKTVRGLNTMNIGYFDFSKLVPISARSGLRSPLHYLGPLCNPLKLDYKILGCVNESHLKLVESIIDGICPNYMLTCNPNIDELSLADLTFVVEKRDGEKRRYLFDPRENGLPYVDYSKILHPGDVKVGAELLLSAISGEKGPIRDTLALNAGAGMYLSKKSSSIRKGYHDAQALIESGEALKKLNEWRAFQRQNGS